MVMQLRSCCCGCSLRTGTIIIAVFGLLGGIFTVLEGLTQGGAADAKNGNITMLMEPMVYPTLLPTPIPDSGNGTNPDPDVIPGQHGFRISETIYGVVEILTCLLLLVGAIKNSAKLVYPWIVVNLILCILGVITFLGMGIIFCLSSAMAFGVGYIVLGVVFALFRIYFILVVNSFHTTLKSGPMSRA